MRQRDNKGRFVKGHRPVNNHLRDRKGRFATLEQIDEEVEETRAYILRMWKVLAGYDKRKPCRCPSNPALDDDFSGVEVEYDEDYEEYC